MKFRSSWPLILSCLCGAAFQEEKGAPPPESDHKIQRARLLEELGSGFRATSTRHYLVVYQEEASELADYARTTLENTFETFLRDTRRAGLAPELPTETLVCIIFDDEQDWRSYCKRLRLEWRTGGVYDAKSARVNLLDERQRTLQEGEEARTPVQIHADNLGKIGHEAAHQLSFQAGLLSEQGDFPLWVGEGLAECFEPDLGLERPGLYSKWRPRSLWRLRQAREAGGLLALSAFVGLRSSGAPKNEEDLGRLRVAYAEAYALVRFLTDTRQEELAGYFAGLRTGTPDFEACFGAHADVQVEFDAYLGRVLRD